MKTIYAFFLLIILITSSCTNRYGGNGKLDVETNDSSFDYSLTEPTYPMYKKGSLNQIFNVKFKLDKTKKDIINLFYTNNITTIESMYGQRHIIKTNYSKLKDNDNVNRLVESSLLFELLTIDKEKCTEVNVNSIVRSRGKREENWFSEDVSTGRIINNYKFVFDYLNKNRCHE